MIGEDRDKFKIGAYSILVGWLIGAWVSHSQQIPCFIP